MPRFGVMERGARKVELRVAPYFPAGTMAFAAEMVVVRAVRP